MVSVRLAVREGLQGRAPEPSSGDDWAKGGCPTPCCVQAELGWPVLPAFFPIGPGALEMGPRLVSHLFLWLSHHLLGVWGGKAIEDSPGRRRLPREGNNVSFFP